MTTAIIPTDVLNAMSRALATARAHNAERAEFVRVYGAERGRDEFRALPAARTARGPAAAATCRELIALAASHGITARALLAATAGAGC